MLRLALAAVAIVALTAALSAVFVPVSDAPGAGADVKFTRVDNMTKVDNPNAPELTIDETAQHAVWTHCCDGGKWTLTHDWDVPEEMTPGEGTAVKLSLAASGVEPEDEQRYFQMAMFAPDFNEALGFTYPERGGESETFHFPISAGYASTDHLTITIQVVSAKITYYYKRVSAGFCRGRDTARPAARAAAINEVRVVSVSRSGVFAHKADQPEGQWCPVVKDTVLKQSDEISVDPDGEVVLAFADNSTTTLRGGPTQLKIASYFTEGGVVKTEILIKMGEVAAQVNKSEATKSDFRIKSPTAGAAPRGTKFKVFYDPGSKTTLTSVTEGHVAVDPTKAGLKTVLVSTGKEVEVGPRSMTKVVRIGKAGARKGNNRSEALARVRVVIARGDDPCGSTTPFKGGIGITPAEKGWAVSVKLIGKHHGKSKWLVAGRKVKPRNALARQIKTRCA